MSEKSFRERLLEKGVPEHILDKQDLEALEKEMKEEELEEDFMAKILQFQDYLENFEKYKRRRIGLTLAEPVHEILKYLVKDIVDPEGNPYPLSYFIEDMLVWVIKNPEIYQQFLDETYPEEEDENDKKEGEEN